ncbi:MULTISPECIES: beta-aspartyl-peptidase [unclassified Colwellia]|jgi:beta-aspartyl-dipeptidase (metallo-type)|uniref:beta-aspartyl-peptidase n=1 Tax=unclassified Colwellia TaxID=196834 RepID=UPI0015F574B6|nr:MULTISPECIES: beta-aspartyl-peptidase [unclassified Colwellia]MBA6417451.1 beta-aspartyl-peptidase [Colwellia sp. 6M3]|tara:strand:+ start:259 stop:1446 length:1188 start_codon:yes stop_codon:yes gene_type:complete
MKINQPMLQLLCNVNIYAPTPLGIKDVLIAGNKIAAIYDHGQGQIDIPKQWHVNIINFEGATLTPGFIDSHAHITGGGGEAGFATQVPPVGLTEFTHAGVTTVVGLLGTDDTTRSTENLLSRVYGLREEGMSAYCWTGGYHYPLTTITGSAKSDIVFLEPVIGIGEFAISDHRSSQPTFEEVIRLASETHVAGLITGKAGIIHFHLGDGEKRLALIEQAIRDTELPARVFNPTHVNRNKALFEDSCKLLTQGCHIDLTAFPAGTAQPGWEASDAIEMAIERQLPLEQITLSSDGGGCLPCFDPQGELVHMDFGRASTLGETLVETLHKGLPLEQVLPMLTSNVANILRFKNKGQIAVGFDADLLIMNEKYEITDVMAQGVWHKQNNQTIIKGTFE